MTPFPVEGHAVPARQLPVKFEDEDILVCHVARFQDEEGRHGSQERGVVWPVRLGPVRQLAQRRGLLPPPVPDDRRHPRARSAG